MNIHEYQAKDILRKYHVPCSSGIVILNKKAIKVIQESLKMNLIEIISVLGEGFETSAMLKDHKVWKYI